MLSNPGLKRVPFFLKGVLKREPNPQKKGIRALLGILETTLEQNLNKPVKTKNNLNNRLKTLEAPNALKDLKP